MSDKMGLYIHIPFCKSKCPYCDFYSTKYDYDSAKEYVNDLCEHMQDYSGEIDTIYFGGGTPSIIEPQLIGKILDTARERFEVDKDSEITIECNPSKDLADDFKKYADYGINRVSIGMQSAVDKERFALGRSAGRVQVAKTIADARNAGITNISLDLMLGTPNQTIDSLDETFDFIRQMNVSHISAYMLKIENGTKFYDMQDRLVLPDEDTVAEMYLKTINELEKMGIMQYEISNFARIGYESRHNTKYWRLVDYIGIGKTAHSCINGRRFYYDKEWNKIDDGKSNTDEERIMLGLRLTQGVPKSIIQKPYAQFVQMGLIKETDTSISLTPQGMLVSNIIINELI